MIKNILASSLFLFCSLSFATPEPMDSSSRMISMRFLRNTQINGNENFPLHRRVERRLRAQGLDPSQYQLMGVSLYAKSHRGRARATLIVGNDRSRRRIPKAASNSHWHSTASQTHRLVEWDLRQSPGAANERWRMRFRGNIRIHRMEVHISQRLRHVRIPMHGHMFTNAGNNVIQIRRELRRMGIDSRGADLRRVVLVAKSRRGRGRAQLRIGNNWQNVKRVHASQNGFNFNSERPRSYNRIRWRTRGQTRGAWQIHLRGRIKVKAVIVTLR